MKTTQSSSRRKDTPDPENTTPFTIIRSAIDEAIYLSKSRSEDMCVARGLDFNYYALPREDAEGLSILFSCSFSTAKQRVIAQAN